MTSLELIAAKSALGIDSSEDIRHWIDENVSLGRVEDGVIDLYLEMTNATPQELLASIREVMSRKKMHWPSQDEARKTLLRALSEDIVTGALSPSVGARTVWAQLGAGQEGPLDPAILQYGQLSIAWDDAGAFREEDEFQLVADRRRAIEAEILKFARSVGATL